MAIFRGYFDFIVFCLTITLGRSQGKLPYPNNNFALFIFGDSFFDAGNNNYLKNPVFRANMLPYGESFFNSSTGRFSDGRLIPDFLAEYEELPLQQPFLQPGNANYQNGVNFASAGAGALVETLQGMVVSLPTQLDNFKVTMKELKQKLGGPEANLLISKSLYLLSIGVNDYVFSKTSSAFQSYSNQEFVDIVVGNTTYLIKEIYKRGGRRFGLLNVGEFGCAPFERIQNSSGGCVEEVNVLIQLHNRALSNVLKDMQRKMNGFQYSVLDFYTLLSERINDPSKYGFKDGKTACCGSGPYRGTFNCGGKDYESCDNPSDYVFFDSAHLSEKAYKQMSEIMWNGTPDLVSPYNLKTLLG